MTDTGWTWLLFGMEVIGVSGMFFIGRRHWWGWLIVLFHSVPWFIYSVIHNKPGFIAMSGLWWTINAMNAYKWRREVFRRGN